MKTYTIHTTSILDRWTRFPQMIRGFLGAMLIAALMIPVVAISQPYANPATVDLGTSADFVILAKTGISTTGTTHITGDIGVSPAAATYITGFGLSASDTTQTFTTSSLVTGNIFAANYALPTPTKMTTAVGDMETAFTTAAGRAPNATELYAGDLTGQTLTRGVYKWTNTVLISAGGVTISGSATDVWIFQIAQNLTVDNGAHVTLIGGALASNIFWQVAGHVTLGTTAQMKGIILCKTNIAMNTGETLDGRALAQTAVTLIANTVTNPVTTGAQLTVVSTLPVNNAINVPLQTMLSITFSSPLDTVVMKIMKDSRLSNIKNTGSEYYSADAKTLNVGVQLESNTAYFVAIFSAKGKDGSTLKSPFVYYFTTGSSFPSITVSGTVSSGTTGVSPQNSIVGLSTTTLERNGTPNFVAWANVDSNGTFTIPNVPKGILYPVAAKDVDNDGQINPDKGIDVVAIVDSIDVESSVTGVNLIFTRTTTSVGEILSVPSKFSLAQNYPNPFNPSTKIQYTIGNASLVSLKVYDVLGREVATLVNDRQEAGSYIIPFGINNGTLSLSSGVYFYRLQAGFFVSTKKLILMK